MVRFPTILILGAGASVPYGFPCGRKLIDVICEDINNLHSKFKLNLQQCGYEEKLIIDFRRRLHFSMLPSIDTFLEKNPEFTEIGKASISQALIPAETPGILQRNAVEEHWYEYLYGHLNAKLEDFGKNRLAILTFNYDRSLEYFLFVALQNSFNLSNEDTVKLLGESIEIIHLHGTLGSFPFMGQQKERYYTPEINPKYINLSASCIKLPHEESEESHLFRRAHELIENAKRVCFLGFGYHQDNLGRLINKVREKLDTSWNFRSFHGTAFGIMDAERQPIKSMFRGKLQLGEHGQGILSYLRNNDIFLS